MMASIPEEMQVVIKQIKNAANKRSALELAYSLLARRYRGERIKTYTRIFELRLRDITVLWNKQGFLHCNHINTILIELLVRSGHFNHEDIERKWTLVWYVSPHQYLSINVGDDKIDVDIWGKNYGIPFGKYAYGFNSKLTAVE